MARLATVHMVLEARGLDVFPFSRQKLATANDTESVRLADIIFKDEITHVKSGMVSVNFISLCFVICSLYFGV